jgi:phage terminase Nu1 subunit (DNA packaging protein)
MQNRFITADGHRSKYFDLAKTISAIVARSSKRDAAGSYSAERSRFTAAKAKLAELELRRQAGQMISVDTAIRHAVAVEALTKTRLLAVPAKVAGRCANRDPADIEQILRAEIEEALAMLAKLGDLGGDLDEEPDAESTEQEGAEVASGGP